MKPLVDRNALGMITAKRDADGFWRLYPPSTRSQPGGNRGQDESGARGGAEGTDNVGTGAPRRSEAQIPGSGLGGRSERAVEPPARRSASPTPRSYPVSR